MPPRRRNQTRRQGELNEAAQLADPLQQVGYTKRHRPHHQPRLLPGLAVLHTGAAFAPALRQILAAVETGCITDLPEPAAIATRQPACAPLPRPAMCTPPAAAATHPASAARSASAPTTPRNAPTAPQTGGFDAADFARRVDAAGGDVTAAVHQWLVETGRIRPDAQIIHFEVRTWRRR
ncbi:helix-turn-helix domain containing protein [Streptomyces chartreusis]|uniref:helix-turn-helix domain containing protein n=1 Tax=Streptomyces chartreusis TaxID=1969 RepID=UPI00362ED829